MTREASAATRDATASGHHGGSRFGRLGAVLDGDLDAVDAFLYRHPREGAGGTEVSRHPQGTGVGRDAELVRPCGTGGPALLDLLLATGWRPGAAGSSIARKTLALDRLTAGRMREFLALRWQVLARPG